MTPLATSLTTASRITPALIAAMCVMMSITTTNATDGVVHDTGLNVSGQLGLGNAADQVNFSTVYGLTDVVEVASGSAHTLALRADGTVWAWGNNAQGQLGIGTTSFRSLVPVQVTGIANAVAVSAGNLHSLALLADGTVKSWGNNINRQLGNTVPGLSSSPINVQFGVTNIIAIDAGLFHSMALRNDGRVFVWGNNAFGQMGLGHINSPHDPILVPDLTNITAIAAGHYHNLALDVGGTMRAWGHNGRGQIGNGSTTHILVPIPVTAITGATAIAAGGLHSLARLDDGTVLAWGKNASGQLGLGTTVDALTPQLVPSLNSIVAVAAGSSHTVARDNDGVVTAWGFNNYGQLGDGTQIDSSSPMVIAGALGASAIACGDFQTFTLGRQPFCPADIAPQPNGDFTVNVQDLLAVISAWGACANPPPDDCPADLEPPGGDDVVDVQDLLAVIGAWGACP